MHGDSVDVEIVMDDVHIAENVGVGLFTSLLVEHPQSNIQLRLNRTKMVHNFLVKDKLGHVVRFERVISGSGSVYISLESVMIINNSLVFQYENMWNSQLSSLSVMNTKVHFKKTGFFNNSIPAVHSYNSDLHFHAGAQCRRGASAL